MQNPPRMDRCVASKQSCYGMAQHASGSIAPFPEIKAKLGLRKAKLQNIDIDKT